MLFEWLISSPRAVSNVFIYDAFNITETRTPVFSFGLRICVRIFFLSENDVPSFIAVFETKENIYLGRKGRVFRA